MPQHTETKKNGFRKAKKNLAEVQRRIAPFTKPRPEVVTDTQGRWTSSERVRTDNKHESTSDQLHESSDSDSSFGSSM